jgi:hypothetical protein
MDPINELPFLTKPLMMSIFGHRDSILCGMTPGMVIHMMSTMDHRLINYEKYPWHEPWNQLYLV